MCVREFVRETKRSLDDVRQRLHFLQYDEIDLWRSVQNFEYNIEDSSTIIRELFANTQPTQPFSQVVTPIRKSANYLKRQHR